MGRKSNCGNVWKLKLAQHISKGASNLKEGIDELLDLARGELGMLELNLRLVDLLRLLRTVDDDVTPMFSRRKQSLELDLLSSLPLVHADEIRLRHVVLNLLTNASKFIPNGGKITLRADQEDPTVVVEVQDTGPGISRERQRHLFELYQQLELDVDKERTRGVGLGLALCKLLVEAHGGRIWVKSQVGKGSTSLVSQCLKLHDINGFEVL